MDVALLLLIQSDGANPIMPAPSEVIWSVVSVAVLLVPVVIAVLVVRYLIGTRRIAEGAASEAASLRQELGQRQP